MEGEERVQVALNVLRLRNHFSKRTCHSAAETWRERGPFKSQGTEQARELTCARRTNINRKELHNAERTKKKLLYEQWVGWRVSIRLAITARLRGFTTIFPSSLQESADKLQITLYASAVIYGREPPQWCDALCLVLFLGRMRLALARSPPPSPLLPVERMTSPSLSPPCAQILNYCFGIWCHHS